MSLIPISRGLRLGLTSAFELTFAAELETACRDFGVKPALRFNWPRAEDGLRNCFDGNRGLGDLLAEGADLPAVTWWVADGRDENREKPRRFSGTVGARWRFFLAVKGRYNTGLADQRDAVEAAIAATMVSMDLVDGRYRKDLSWGEPVEVQWIDLGEAHVGWVQVVEFNASFEVNV